MPSARYDLSIGAARAGTLFASPLQRSDEPAVRSASLKPSGIRSPSSQQPDGVLCRAQLKVAGAVPPELRFADQVPDAGSDWCPGSGCAFGPGA